MKKAIAIIRTSTEQQEIDSQRQEVLSLATAAGYTLDEIEVVGKKGAPIKIGEIHIGDKSDTVDGAEEELKNKIKTCLNDFYNVQVRNIYITVQKN